MCRELDLQRTARELGQGLTNEVAVVVSQPIPEDIVGNRYVQRCFVLPGERSRPEPRVERVWIQSCLEPRKNRFPEVHRLPRNS